MKVGVGRWFWEGFKGVTVEGDGMRGAFKWRGNSAWRRGRGKIGRTEEERGNRRISGRFPTDVGKRGKRRESEEGRGAGGVSGVCRRGDDGGGGEAEIRREEEKMEGKVAERRRAGR